MKTPKADRSPTYVALITQHLADADDFVKLDTIVKSFSKTITTANVYRSLRHLKDHSAADFIFENGSTYWFLTLDTDDRHCQVPERQHDDHRKSPSTARRHRQGKPTYSVVHGSKLVGHK